MQVSTKTWETMAEHSRLLVDDSWFKEVSGFLFYPSRSIDQSWLKDVAKFHGLAPQDLPKDEKSLSKLIRLMKDLKVEDGDFEFDLEIKAIALRCFPYLESLMLWAGICLHHESLKSYISKKDQLTLRSEIGGSGYRFALKRAPFIMPSRPEATPLDLSGGLQGVAQKLRKAGLECFLKANHEASLGFKQRVILKFPASWQVQENVTTTDDESRKATQLILKVQKEVENFEAVSRK